MKIRLWSDVHNEFGVLKYKKHQEDSVTVLVIAGDFTIGVDHMDMMLELCNNFYAVVFCCGNHEYYHRVVNEVNKQWRDFADSCNNFYFLDGDHAIIDDVRFVGGTFWTDMDNGALGVKRTCEHRMNDYNHIRIRDEYDENRHFTPEDSIKINKLQRAYIEAILDTPFKGRTVVVTHHAPLEICIDPKYRHHSSDRVLNFAYRNTGLEKWFEEKEFTHWLHGHIHNRQEHNVNGKLVIANPRGYQDYEAMADTFEDDKVFEV